MHVCEHVLIEEILIYCFLKKFEIVYLVFLSSFFSECDWQTEFLNERLKEKNEKMYLP